MKIKRFSDTDTLYIEPCSAEVEETRELEESTLLDLGSEGRLCAMAIEHASERMAIPDFSYEQVPT